jgi:hypothetical protein
MADVKSTFDALTPEQRDHLREVSKTLRYEKLTASFSIEGRDLNGNKKSAFYCVTASRGHGGEVSLLGTPAESVSYDELDARLAHCLLSKHVVSETYLDAVRRGIMSSATAREEMTPILRGYDERAVKLLQGKDSNG